MDVLAYRIVVCLTNQYFYPIAVDKFHLVCTQNLQANAILKYSSQLHC